MRILIAHVLKISIKYRKIVNTFLISINLFLDKGFTIKKPYKEHLGNKCHFWSKANDDVLNDLMPKDSRDKKLYIAPYHVNMPNILVKL